MQRAVGMKFYKRLKTHFLKPAAPKYSLNEAVSFEKSAIFIAVPKTGTTTVREQLRDPDVNQWIIPNPHLNIMQVRDTLYVYFLKKNLGRNSEFPSSQDVLTDSDIRKKAEDTFNSFFKFASVRNPWERVVSLYFRREGVIVRDKISFKDFCENHFYSSDTCRHPTLHKNQLDWLCDENGTVIMDYVYKLEDSSDAFLKIIEMTDGRVDIRYRKDNVNPTSKSKSYKDMYDSETKKLIGKRFEKDIDYFGFSF